MNNLNKIKSILLSLLITFCFASQAKDDQWYQVEIIVFEHLDKSGLQEAWPLEPGKPNFNATRILQLPERAQSTEDDRPNFVAVPDEALQLQDAKERIKKQGSYRIVMHKGWKQKVTDKKIAEKLRLIGGKNYFRSSQDLGNHMDMENDTFGASADVAQNSFEVDGTLLLSKSRHLHLETDLVFTKPMKVLSPVAGFEGSMSAASAPKVTLANVKNRNQWQNETNARLQPFRLKESVRLRTNEVQYIDHPIYGILFAIIPEENS